MSKPPVLAFGTKAEFKPTAGSRIGAIIKKGANLLADEQRPLLETVAKQLINGTANGKAHAHRR